MIKDYTVTLNGAAQRISSVLPDQTNLAADDPPCRTIYLQADGANGAAIFVGSSSAVSSTNYGMRIPAAVGGIPAAPIAIQQGSMGAPLKLQDFYVVGTNAEKLHVLTVQQ